MASLVCTLTAAAPAAAADVLACAPTSAAAAQPAPAPGAPCWVDVTPYPFGVDGDPVATRRQDCPAFPETEVRPDGYNRACYLSVTSLAFRAWNRGLASTSPILGTSPYGVWIFNGTRWYPDPSFPGRGTCKGKTVLWAGKLDYWLVGSADGTRWPALCRFDGANFAWQPIDVPDKTLAAVTTPGATTPDAGAITSGSCFAWDDCWFFGNVGTVLRWDGLALTDATPDPQDPWLRTDFTAALAGVDSSGRRFGAAVGTTGGTLRGRQVSPQPDGSAPPQLFGSSGGRFSPSPFRPPTVAGYADPARTDLVAVTADRSRRGWVAGNPVGYLVENSTAGAIGPDERRTTDPQPAPVMPFPVGARPGCRAPSPGFEFDYADRPNGRDAFLWASLSVFPDSGDALAVGRLRPAEAGSAAEDDGRSEPVVARVGCNGTVTTTRFREPVINGGPDAPLAPADRLGYATAAAANAHNDAWAAASDGIMPSQFGDARQRPHVYRLTDGAKPDAPAGDDDEERPVITVEDPPIFVDEPPPSEPAPAASPPVQTTQTVRKPKRIRRKAAVFSVKVDKKPRPIGGGRFKMVVRFRVRRTVTLGVQALRRGKVVSRSGLKRFTGRRGRLVLRLDRRHWPTGIRFYTRRGKAASLSVGLPGSPR